MNPDQIEADRVFALALAAAHEDDEAYAQASVPMNRSHPLVRTEFQMPATPIRAQQIKTRHQSPSIQDHEYRIQVESNNEHFSATTRATVPGYLQARNRSLWQDDSTLARAMQAMEFEIAEEMDREDRFNEDFNSKEYRASSCKRQMRTLSFFIVLVQIVILIIMISTDGIAPSGENPMIGPPASTLVIWGAKETGLMKYKGEWWRLISPIMLHAGVLHLLSNAFIQLRVGGYLNRVFGTPRWLFIYLISGVYGNILSCVFLSNTVGVGSSGALLGMLTSWIVWIIFRWYRHFWFFFFSF